MPTKSQIHSTSKYTPLCISSPMCTKKPSVQPRALHKNKSPSHLLHKHFSNMHQLTNTSSYIKVTIMAMPLLSEPDQFPEKLR